MARPQVADGGTASNVEGSCEYIEKAVADRRQVVVLQGVGRGANNCSLSKPIMLRNVHTELGTAGGQL
jgi:hypothetical protein